MKSITQTTSAPIIAAILAFSLVGPRVQANQITGSIGFGALGVTINSSALASASSFTLTSPFVSETHGDYTVVPDLTPVTFNGFQFSPPVGSVTPLWTFAFGGITYSFDATSVLSAYNSTLREWDIGGSGIALATGFDATPGTWTVNLSQSGVTVVFDASSAATPVGTPPVPDGGSPMALLGGTLIGLGVLSRKFRI